MTSCGSKSVTIMNKQRSNFSLIRMRQISTKFLKNESLVYLTVKAVERCQNVGQENLKMNNVGDE